MKPINPEQHYQIYQDLFHTRLTANHMAGAVPHPDRLILEIVPPAPSSLSNANKGGLILTETTKASDPIVYRVLAAGSSTPYQPEDLVCISFMSGDKFSGSNIVSCHKDDVIFKWGHGIQK